MNEGVQVIATGSLLGAFWSSPFRYLHPALGKLPLFVSEFSFENLYSYRNKCKVAVK